jgi:GntR family transcriptional regulator, transcriptional repressor for pyruvate dehydrogenase complex
MSSHSSDTSKLDGQPELRQSIAPRPIRKSYEQVADQLREFILTGELAPGSRLPTEAVLAQQFGVSRPTVREALRLLAAQNFVGTVQGPRGGSYITIPSVDHISDFLSSSIGLLAESRDVSLDELLEAREVFDTRAARLAALRRTDEDLDRLRSALSTEPLSLTAQKHFAFSRDFHGIVLEVARNTLLYIAAQPVFSVLQTNLARSALGRSFHQTVNAHHHEIADAIAASDPAAAEEQMRAHLEFLGPSYEKAWRERARRTGPRPTGLHR